MNINIYNSSSFIDLIPNDFNQKHTVSSLNKIKVKKLNKQIQSTSDFASSSCLQMLTSASSNRKTFKQNTDMYKLGQQFLQHKKEKQQQLIHQLEAKFQQSCPFSPQITSNSRVIASVSKTTVDRGRQSSELIDSQSIKLQKELEECTFSPQILRRNIDIFDRSSPFYFRQIDWKSNLQEKLQANRSQNQTQSTISQNKQIHPKYLDLRASHALKKNISAKYLRQSLTQI
ncbi:unnamed protein product (macronuclear) [Paramecium tetraurelia]|uniref:Uncharacterized protein n=1 Tax=Paramecium tetraurelia TaxID=5888 RepID=A0C1P2_PARTE|nr:uncharacterized protein GSPATT00034186001 [Paramecium tetraurelia]CAK64709.1 unnamed protein product [Paramecium tetraurelia]|eukprot:XP_001432106.1 hypothetical protein (macronuclear) [Paramecium tetraurelia strain d4-2]